jgi:hypothetical protein
MPLDNPTYDIAISFLVRDEAIAAEMKRKLSQGLNVFFFPHKQEELAGTNGLESMRTPFYDDSRLIVVLYREPWGETPWTRVESTAIQESMFKFGWPRLFFIDLDRKSKLPVWLPNYGVRFNMEDFGIEQAVGAIKARVQELGGHYQPMSPAKRAELLMADEEYRRELSSIRAEDATESARELFAAIKAQCDALQQTHDLGIECGISFVDRAADKSCLLRSSTMTLQVVWSQPYLGHLKDAQLIIRELNGRMLLPGEGFHIFVELDEIKKTHYLPHLSRTLEHGWKPAPSEDFTSNNVLAEHIVIRMMELMDARSSGKLKEPQPRHARVIESRSPWL